ncbi:MAG: ADP-ribosylation factor-like protein [Candidatus Odinarchaeota archaeon]
MLSDFLRLIKGFVLFIGPSQAGKTSILKRLITGTFEDQEPTLGFQEESIANVRVIEIGGQESFRKYWNDALNQDPVHVFFVIDVTNDKDYEEYQKFIDDYQKDHPWIPQKTILTVNKLDLVTEIPGYLKEKNVKIQCSAKTGEGMLDILENIASFRDEAKAKLPREPGGRSENDQVNDEEEKEKAESILRKYKGKF